MPGVCPLDDPEPLLFPPLLEPFPCDPDSEPLSSPEGLGVRGLTVVGVGASAEPLPAGDRVGEGLGVPGVGVGGTMTPEPEPELLVGVEHTKSDSMRACSVVVAPVEPLASVQSPNCLARVADASVGHARQIEAVRGAGSGGSSAKPTMDSQVAICASALSYSSLLAASEQLPAPATGFTSSAIAAAAVVMAATTGVILALYTLGPAC